MRTHLLLASLALTSCYQEVPLFSPALPDTLPVKYEPASGPTLDASNTHSCAVQRGSLYCWGENDQGQLGTGDFDLRERATRVGLDQDWAGVVTGNKHTCGARTDGSLSCWGQHDLGQLGPALAVSEDARSPNPIDIPLPAPVARLSAGDSGGAHTCAILVDATLWCWGNNGEAQAAQGTSNLTGVPYYTTPQRVLDFSDFSQFTSSQGHNCALRSNGELWCWGRNNAGECCAQDTPEGEITKPQRVPHPEEGRTWRLVEASNSHTCAVDDIDRLWCWGNNSNWSFGVASPAQSFAPTRIELTGLESGEHLVTMSSDTFNMCARTNKDQAWCWGSNFSGQFGAGRTPTMEPPQDPPPMGYVPPRRTPLRVLDAPIRDIEMARFHGCLRTQDERILCAGNSDLGRVGIPSDGDQNTWTQVIFP